MDKLCYRVSVIYPQQVHIRYIRSQPRHNVLKVNMYLVKSVCFLLWSCVYMYCLFRVLKYMILVNILALYNVNQAQE